jgi:hypothetical protein
MGGDKFCRNKTDGSLECLTFRFDYTGDHCSFVVRHAALKLKDGSQAHASFAGTFDRATDPSGYKFAVTNIEFE